MVLRPRLTCLFVVGFLVPLCIPSTSLAWGCNGHKAVAYLAFERLNPHAKAAATDLLQHLQSDPSLMHYCPGDPNLFVEVSTWADDFRAQKPETGSWHFIDIPLGATSIDPKYCPSPPGCVITAIQKDVATLRDAGAAIPEKSIALLFFIHFVGDLHQPLHDTTNNDRGANCLPVSSFGKPPKEQQPGENFTPNLHAIWDTDLVDRAIAGKSLPNFVAYLDAKYGSRVTVLEGQQPNLFNWALQSHHLAMTFAYGKLPVPVTLETPLPVKVCSDDNHVSHRLSALHEVVDDRYFLATNVALEVQLVRAGVRLSAILNRIWQ
jgi:S1/P1 Nuclease